jgi:hypothetical protein
MKKAKTTDKIDMKNMSKFMECVYVMMEAEAKK